MTLRRIEGFERQTSVVDGLNIYGLGNGPSTVSPGATGTGSHIRSAGSGSNQGYVQLNTGANLSQFVMGQRVRFNTPAAMDGRVGFQFRETGVVHLSLARNTVTGVIELFRGGVYGTNLLGSSAAGVSLGSVWNFWEVEALIADSGGWVKVYLNEELIINVSGVDTRNAGTLGTVDNVLIGNYNSLTVDVDDFYVCDSVGSAPFNTVLGDIVVEGLVPNADGDLSQWVGSDGNSLLNYQLVDEIPGVMTDYVQASATGLRDLYNFQNLAVGGGAVLGVEVSALALKSDAGTPPGGLREVLKATGTGTIVTDTIGTLAQLATTAQWLAGNIRITDPDGGAWSVADVDGLQIGFDLA